MSILLPVVLISACKRDSTTAEDNSQQADALPPPSEDYDQAEYKWGFIDRRGQLVIKDRFDEVRPFSEGLALVRQNGQWGYIDAQGNKAIPVKFRAAWPFANGLAKYQAADGRFGFIDKNGQPALEAQWAELGAFSNGLALARKDDLFGYIDRSGKWRIAPQYTKAYPFKDGLAVVQTPSPAFGLIDTMGNTLVPAQFEQLKTPNNGLVRAKQNGLWGILSMDGTWLIEPKFLQLEDFNGDFAAAATEQGFGLINREGKWQIPPGYDQLFSAGYPNLWIFDKAGRYNLVNSDNVPILARDCDEIHPFQQGIASFRQGDLWGFFRVDGTVICPPKYYLSWPFIDNLARVATADGLTFIDTLGRETMPPNPYFIELREFTEGLAPVQVYR